MASQRRRYDDDRDQDFTKDRHNQGGYRRDEKPELQSFTWRDPSTLPDDERRAYEERRAESQREIDAYVAKQQAAVNEWHEQQAKERRDAHNRRDR